MRRKLLAPILVGLIALALPAAASAASCEIDGGDDYCRESRVTVSFDPGYGDFGEYAISNSGYPGKYSSGWTPIPSWTRSIDWDLTEYVAYDGEKTVYMSFRKDSSQAEYLYAHCSDDILLDTHAPTAVLDPKYGWVRRKRTANLRWKTSDDGSGPRSLSLTITRKNRVCKRISYSWLESLGTPSEERGSWSFWCGLRRGSHRVRFVAEDQAGNVTKGTAGFIFVLPAHWPSPGRMVSLAAVFSRRRWAQPAGGGGHPRNKTPVLGRACSQGFQSVSRGDNAPFLYCLAVSLQVGH